MTFNRIQFQHGMSIPEFLRSFGTEAQCAEAVKAARWPNGFHCPCCHSAEHYVVGHGARKLFECNGCRHQTSLRAGSLMEHTKLPLGARQATCRLIYAAIGCIAFSKWALMTQSRSGLSVTAPMGAQLRVLPDHRAGFRARACRYRACRAARMMRSSPL